MKEFKMQKNTTVKLVVKISSDAIAGSNVRLNGDIIKKSGVNSFEVLLGNSDKLDNAKISVWSNFEVLNGNVDAIMEATSVNYTLKSGTQTQQFSGSKIKIDSDYFIALLGVELTL